MLAMLGGGGAFATYMLYNNLFDVEVCWCVCVCV
jgi:hypothetical protein